MSAATARREARKPNGGTTTTAPRALTEGEMGELVGYMREGQRFLARALVKLAEMEHDVTLSAGDYGALRRMLVLAKYDFDALRRELPKVNERAGHGEGDFYEHRIAELPGPEVAAGDKTAGGAS